MIHSHTEMWRDIAGHEGLYQISDKGRVRSLTRLVVHQLNGKMVVREFSGRTISPGKHTHGYLNVVLSKNGKFTQAFVHRLVARAFCDGDDETVNHIDGNKHNNHATNLEWCSYATNNRHARETGLNNGYSKLTKDEALAVCKMCAEGETQYATAKRFGVSKSTVNRVVNGKILRHIQPC